MSIQSELSLTSYGAVAQDQDFMVIKGSMTATLAGDFVVFMIGMRFNQLWAVHKWLPVYVNMPPFGLGGAAGWSPWIERVKPLNNDLK